MDQMMNFNKKSKISYKNSSPFDEIKWLISSKGEEFLQKI